MNLGAEEYMLHGLFLLIYLGVFGDPFPSDDPCLSSLYIPRLVLMPLTTLQSHEL